MEQEILANAESIVRDKLAAWFGPEQLWQVERLSTNIFRAWLAGGGAALAIVQEDGSVRIHELEAAC